MASNNLDKILTLLDIGQEDSVKISKVEILLDFIEDAILSYIGEPSIPPTLSWIVNECVISRFQLLGSEHLNAEGIDVLSFTYRGQSPIKDYAEFLDDWIRENKPNGLRSKKMRML